MQRDVAVFNFIKIQRALTDKAKIGILPTDDFVLEKIIFLAQSVARVHFYYHCLFYHKILSCQGIFEKEKNPAKAGLNDMLVAGIEPATSSLPWMRSAY